MTTPLPPIAIGAVGGSGTRVVADFLQRAGIHMGGVLNGSNDNLWFTFLLKRAAWMAEFPGREDIAQAYDLFRKISLKGAQQHPAQSDTDLIARITKDLAENTMYSIGVGPEDLDQLQAVTGIPETANGQWGWKEPNTHVLLPELDQIIPGFRYIHVIRDGLDMALSNNKAQARNWYSKFMDRQLDPQNLTPSDMLDFWLAANTRTMNYGRTKMGNRFHVLSYEALCTDPSREIRRLFAFLNRPVPADVGPHLVRPSSRGRADPSKSDLFTSAQRQRVAEIMDLAHKVPNDIIL